MNNKLRLFLIIILLAVISINYANGLRGLAGDISSFVINIYMSAKEGFNNAIDEHFNQQDEIRRLREKNAELSELAQISTAYAIKFNSMLQEANLSEYKVKTKIVRALSYVNLGDYNKVWLDFEGFNENKIYGLMYQGYSAGIVTAQNGRALALLQQDPKSTFSVYIGVNKIKGIAFGSGDKIEVRYIPLWSEPKENDEVVTSGLDNIFFEGLKVGKIVIVYKNESYFTAIVEPYAAVEVPGFFHVILSNNEF
ncbi:MAG: rod shape-determining protein MreC [Campylobacteraceae bacterium]|jgi:rod shape-determining protein MreC|nr:rod shape-determining protein MreC [Campylobacteraceae bacterium]